MIFVPVNRGRHPGFQIMTVVDDLPLGHTCYMKLVHGIRNLLLSISIHGQMHISIGMIWEQDAKE